MRKQVTVTMLTMMVVLVALPAWAGESDDDTALDTAEDVLEAAKTAGEALLDSEQTPASWRPFILVAVAVSGGLSVIIVLVRKQWGKKTK